MGSTLKQRTGADHLCIAGGVALNCCANAKVLEMGLYKDVLVFPAAHDAGTAIGAAYLARQQAFKDEGEIMPPPPEMCHPFVGPSFNGDEIKQALHANGLVYKKVPSGELPKIVAKKIAEGEIVAW